MLPKRYSVSDKELSSSISRQSRAQLDSTQRVISSRDGSPPRREPSEQLYAAYPLSPSKLVNVDRRPPPSPPAAIHGKKRFRDDDDDEDSPSKRRKQDKETRSMAVEDEDMDVDADWATTPNIPRLSQRDLDRLSSREEQPSLTAFERQISVERQKKSPKRRSDRSRPAFTNEFDTVVPAELGSASTQASRQLYPTSTPDVGVRTFPTPHSPNLTNSTKSPKLQGFQSQLQSNSQYLLSPGLSVHDRLAGIHQQWQAATAAKPHPLRGLHRSLLPSPDNQTEPPLKKRSRRKGPNVVTGRPSTSSGLEVVESILEQGSGGVEDEDQEEAIEFCEDYNDRSIHPTKRFQWIVQIWPSRPVDEIDDVEKERLLEDFGPKVESWYGYHNRKMPAVSPKTLIESNPLGMAFLKSTDELADLQTDRGRILDRFNVEGVEMRHDGSYIYLCLTDLTGEGGSRALQASHNPSRQHNLRIIRNLKPKVAQIPKHDHMTATYVGTATNVGSRPGTDWDKIRSHRKGTAPTIPPYLHMLDSGAQVEGIEDFGIAFQQNGRMVVLCDKKYDVSQRQLPPCLRLPVFDLSKLSWDQRDIAETYGIAASWKYGFNCLIGGVEEVYQIPVQLLSYINEAHALEKRLLVPEALDFLHFIYSYDTQIRNNRYGACIAKMFGSISGREAWVMESAKFTPDTIADQLRALAKTQKRILYIFGSDRKIDDGIKQYLTQGEESGDPYFKVNKLLFEGTLFYAIRTPDPGLCNHLIDFPAWFNELHAYSATNALALGSRLATKSTGSIDQVDASIIHEGEPEMEFYQGLNKYVMEGGNRAFFSRPMMPFLDRYFETGGSFSDGHPQIEIARREAYGERALLTVSLWNSTSSHAYFCIPSKRGLKGQVVFQALLPGAKPAVIPIVVGGMWRHKEEDQWVQMVMMEDLRMMFRLRNGGWLTNEETGHIFSLTREEASVRRSFGSTHHFWKAWAIYHGRPWPEFTPKELLAMPHLVSNTLGLRRRIIRELDLDAVEEGVRLGKNYTFHLQTKTKLVGDLCFLKSSGLDYIAEVHYEKLSHYFDPRTHIFSIGIKGFYWYFTAWRFEADGSLVKADRYGGRYTDHTLHLNYPLNLLKCSQKTHKGLSNFFVKRARDTELYKEWLKGNPLGTETFESGLWKGDEVKELNLLLAKEPTPSVLSQILLSIKLKRTPLGIKNRLDNSKTSRK